MAPHRPVGGQVGFVQHAAGAADGGGDAPRDRAAVEGGGAAPADGCQRVGEIALDDAGVRSRDGAVAIEEDCAQGGIGGEQVTRAFDLLAQVGRVGQREAVACQAGRGRQDVAERQFWKDYMRAYEDCLAATSSKRSPWYVVPADDKENARLIVARIIVETLKQLDMAYPQPDPARRRELAVLRRQLAK